MTSVERSKQSESSEIDGAQHPLSIRAWELYLHE